MDVHNNVSCIIQVMRDKNPFFLLGQKTFVKCTRRTYQDGEFYDIITVYCDMMNMKA